ncbi:hypothetical protein GCM10017562_41110 [Streptomyces roseofulvus]
MRVPHACPLSCGARLRFLATCQPLVVSVEGSNPSASTLTYATVQIWRDVARSLGMKRLVRVISGEVRPLPLGDEIAEIADKASDFIGTLLCPDSEESVGDDHSRSEV